MRVAVGSDHAGVPLIGAAIDELRSLGHQVVDLGTHDASRPDDYPDYAVLVAEKILNSECERGVLICGSGVGASVAANKIPGIRAGLCHDSYSAHQGVEHDHMNVLVLGARVIGEELARELVRLFVSAKYSQAEHHLRRLAKVAAIEKRCAVQPASSMSPPQRQRDVGREGAALIPYPKP
jgi:ribose 5-phosphate isomerase B